MSATVAAPLAAIYERSTILSSQTSMTEWLNSGNSTQNLRHGIDHESVDIPGQIRFEHVELELKNVRNDTPQLTVPSRKKLGLLENLKIPSFRQPTD